MENQELLIRENVPLTATEIRKQVNLIQEVMTEVMTEGQHYGKIPGCGDKPTLLKPGAEKLSMTFRLRPIMDNEKDITIIDMPDGHREVRVYCHILNAPGLELATGVGSCSTMESKYRYRGGEKKGIGQPVPKEYWNLKKSGKNKEAEDIIGGHGFGTGKVNGEWQICEIGEKMENPDIADTYNTVLKMAKKRAYVDGILSATGASDIFTQDIEDLSEVKNDIVANIKPAVATPQARSPAPVAATVGATTSHFDSSVPSKAHNPISLPQGKRLYAIYKGSGYTDEEVKAFLSANFGIEHTKDIEREFYDDIVDHFNKPKTE